MPFLSTVTRWAPVVDAELSRVSVPLPRDLILAVIQIESRGKPGLVNKKSGASGLMQVMPGTLASYNQNHPPIPLSDLRSSSPQAAVNQIRVGTWVVKTYWKSAYKYLSGRLGDVPVDELARIADLFYVAGPGATRTRLDKLAQPLWGPVQSAYPKWNALLHPRNVFKLLEGLTWPVESISNWLESGSGSILKDPGPKEGFALASIALLVAWWLLKKKGK